MKNVFTSQCLQPSCSSVLASLVLLLVAPAVGQAPSLGSAAGFAVIAASTVTNTGASSIVGDVGVAPGTAITGFPPGIVAGTIHPGDAVALQAHADALLAYNAVVAATCITTLTGQDLGGMTLTPGVYCYAAAAQMTGTLTLDALGDPAAVFFVKTGSTLTTAAAAATTLVNGASAANVFWLVGSSATLGAATQLAGNVLASASITAGAGTTVVGRLLAINAAVTLDTTQVSLPSSATIENMGPGCGNPPPVLSPVGSPTLGSAAFALRTNSGASATMFVFQSFAAANVQAAPSCTLYLDSATFAAFAFDVLVDGAGAGQFAAPVPNDAALQGLRVYWQAVEYVVGGPVMGSFAFSNGLVTVLGA